MLAKLKLAVLNCQDYTNGYYAALSRLADDESIDFVVHLGDYRHLYQRVRSDPFMQQAMENHTWIIATDDHETADDLIVIGIMKGIP